MPKYTVTKKLELEFECEAKSRKHAEELCIDADDTGPLFTLIDCQYEVEPGEHPDTNLTTADLQAKYPLFAGQSGGHPDFPYNTWCREVATGETVLGYYAWVETKIEESNHEDE